MASPQDSISAIFANPAAMCFGAYCPGSEATFAGTFFYPTVDSKADFSNIGGGTGESDSQMEPFVVPAIGISTPPCHPVYGLVSAPTVSRVWV